MARFRFKFSEEDKKHFPLRSTDAVVELFREQLEDRKEPNLTLLSIVLGALENSLTLNRAQTSRDRTGSQKADTDVSSGQTETAEPEPPTSSKNTVSKLDKKRCTSVLPALQLSVVEALYEYFVTNVKGSVDVSSHTEKFSTAALVKRVSDVIWAALTRTFYKDRAHLQTIFTLLTECKLDCFGMAVCVIAACQALQLDDVHLALSEDHAWAVFGDSQESVEITWHGKGSEDKRGQAVVCNGPEKCWLYLSPVVCTRHTEVAAMVTSINPAISSTADSLDMAVLQQKLLWLLYDLGHLNKYPAALATLADLEEVSPTESRPPALDIYTQSVNSSRLHYDDTHIYPYTYLGNYHYRRANYKEALRNWAEAARVISRYNYNRDDEEVYKEFLEIANEMIPNIMRTSSGDQPTAGGAGTAVLPLTDRCTEKLALTSDPECYAMVLQFYDGLCEWEEGSSTPVLHITWAQHALYSLGRFDHKARANLSLKSATPMDDDDDTKSEDSAVSSHSGKLRQVSDRGSHRSRGKATKAAEDDGNKSMPDANGDQPSAAEVSPVAENEDKQSEKSPALTTDVTEAEASARADADNTDTVMASLVLRSVKMMGMKDLLIAERLNSGAIKLQLTAQSQVHLKHSRTAAATGDYAMSDITPLSMSRKRIRRE